MSFMLKSTYKLLIIKAPHSTGPPICLKKRIKNFASLKSHCIFGTCNP